MKIDSNISVEEVKVKTKDSLNGLCNINNNQGNEEKGKQLVKTIGGK